MKGKWADGYVCRSGAWMGSMDQFLAVAWGRAASKIPLLAVTERVTKGHILRWEKGFRKVGIWVRDGKFVNKSSILLG